MTCTLMWKKMMQPGSLHRVTPWETMSLFPCARVLEVSFGISFSVVSNISMWSMTNVMCETETSKNWDN